METPLREGESRVEKEIKEEEQNSVLPDYLKTLFEKEGKEESHSTPIEKEDESK